MEFSTFSVFGLDTKRVKIGVEVGPVDWSLQSRSQRDCRDGLVVEVDENGWKASGLQQFADGFYGSFVATMMALPPYFLEHKLFEGDSFFFVYGMVNMDDSTCRHTGRTCELEKKTSIVSKQPAAGRMESPQLLAGCTINFADIALQGGKYATHHLLPRLENPLTYILRWVNTSTRTITQAMSRYRTLD